MTSKLTVVMYHYVRDLVNSRYPEIKGLDVRLFDEQISYIQKHYNPVTMEGVIDAINGKIELPEKAILLTFDDGYIDHFDIVFPRLYNRGIQGSFFAPVRAILERKVLDVNKIHFILASTKNINTLLNAIKNILVKYRERYHLDSFESYYAKLATASRYDTPDVIFVKKLLQVELDLEVRMKIVDELFSEIVGVNENVFSSELYMSIDQMKTMVKAGMHIGSHGYDHFWLGSLCNDAQEFEIQKSIEFIDGIGGDENYMTICFPYGNYNENLLALLKRYNFKAGFTTEVQIADITSNVFTLDRIDTNDLPKIASAPINDWWYKG